MSVHAGSALNVAVIGFTEPFALMRTPTNVCAVAELVEAAAPEEVNDDEEGDDEEEGNDGGTCASPHQTISGASVVPEFVEFALDGLHGRVRCRARRRLGR